MINSVVWGFVFVALGLCLIIKSLFGISIPFIRAIIGAICIYIGVALATGIGSPTAKSSKLTWFSKEKIVVVPEIKTYNVVLGQTTIDLSRVPLQTLDRLNISTIMGSCTVKIPTHLAVLIKGDSAVGGIQFPDESVLNWGKKKYITRPGTPPQLIINAKAILGTLVFTYI